MKSPRPRVAVPFLIVLSLLGAGCGKKPAGVKTARAIPSRDEFAGSEACGECHSDKLERWHDDWHARALSPATDQYVRGTFDETHFQGASSEAWMSRDRGEYVMRTEPASGPAQNYRVEWLIGGKRMQDAVTTFPDGRWQVLPVYYHVTGKEWVDYNEKKQGLVTKDHPFFWTNFRRTANHECLDCHTSGLDVRYDRTTHQWSTKFADAGVACESCHGPGARHAATKAAADIVRPDELDRDRSLAVCGNCHGPREPIYPFLDAKHRFRPGDSYDEKLRPLAIVDGRERSGEFFADGRPSSSSFEYQALLESRCYMQGEATCLSCHTAPHDKQVSAELKPSRHPGVLPGDETCRNCHANVFAAGAQHTHHTTQAAQSCIACHMPPVVTGVLDRFADHTLDVPNPRNTVAHGVPNACNVCHGDKTPQAMQAAITSWWPNAAARQSRRARLADAIDEKTASDSKAALIAVMNDRGEAPILRGAAAQLLAQRFPDDAPKALAPLLKEQNALLRSRVLEAFGFANANGSEDVIAPLLDDPAPKVRERAAVVLATLRDPRGEAALAKLVNDPATDTMIWPHLLLGTAIANRGDLEGAAQQMNRALDVVPYLPDALVFLADISMRKGNPDGARAYLEEALRFDPRHRGATRRITALQSMRVPMR